VSRCILDSSYSSLIASTFTLTPGSPEQYAPCQSTNSVRVTALSSDRRFCLLAGDSLTWVEHPARTAAARPADSVAVTSLRFNVKPSRRLSGNAGCLQAPTNCDTRQAISPLLVRSTRPGEPVEYPVQRASSLPVLLTLVFRFGGGRSGVGCSGVRGLRRCLGAVVGLLALLIGGALRCLRFHCLLAVTWPHYLRLDGHGGRVGFRRGGVRRRYLGLGNL